MAKKNKVKAPIKPTTLAVPTPNVENCPKCGSKHVAVSTSAQSTRFCKCSHVWTPLSNDELLIATLKDRLSQNEMFAKRIVNLVDGVITANKDGDLKFDLAKALIDIRSNSMGIR